MTRLLGLAALVVAIFVATAVSNAALITYVANLDGPSEDTPNASPGTGFAQVDYDDDVHTLRVQVDFSDLTVGNSAAHIHSATAVAGTGLAGVATTTPTFTDFPGGVTSGTYDHTFDLTLASSWNGAYITANGGTTAGAEAALATGLADGKAYLNIHTGNFPAGEIRGFLNVPEPTSIGLFAVGVIAFVVAQRARRFHAGL